jgi:DNA-binding NtrC family response regulator
MGESLGVATSSILLVEDFEELLELETILIESVCGRTAVPAKNLREVIAHGESALKCEFAIIDINLGAGEPSGVDVYHWLRSKGFEGHIFFLTGHAKDSPIVAEATRLGDVKVFSKPIVPDRLIRIMRGEFDA